MTEGDARAVAGPVKLFDVVIVGRQLAWLTFVVRVLLNRDYIQARELLALVDPAEVVLRFVVLLFFFGFRIGHGERDRTTIR